MVRIVAQIDHTIAEAAEWAAVLVVSQEHGEFVAVGPIGSTTPSSSLELWGDWEAHPKYGERLKVTKAVEVVSDPEEWIKAFLASGACPGIDEVLGGRIARHFGSELSEIMDSQPERLLDVQGIGPQRLESVVKGWQHAKELRLLLQTLGEIGVSVSNAKKLLKLCSSSPEETFRANPWILSIIGVPLAECDEFAEGLGLSSFHMCRIAAYAYEVLSQQENDGHTSMPVQDLIRALEQIFDAEMSALVGKVLRDLSESSWGPDEGVRDREERRMAQRLQFRDREVYTASLVFAEDAIVDWAKYHLSGEAPVDRAETIESLLGVYQERYSFQFNEDQRLAVVRALTHPVSVITGGPGVGKTTVIRALCWVAAKLDIPTSLAAPTGKAAVRMEEVTGANSQTLHRLLGLTPSSALETNQSSSTGMDQGALVVDEVSMVDLRLMGHLCAQTVYDHTILVGDPDQLPSVGPGSVLHDFLKTARFPVTTLTQVYRQAEGSGIILGARDVLCGAIPQMRGDLEWRSTGQSRMLHKFLTFYQEVTSQWEDVQVLCPTYKGSLGIDALNYALQDLRQGSSGQEPREFGTLKFYAGDPVIFTRNDYTLGVFNGMSGVVEDASPDAPFVLTVRVGTEVVSLQTADLRILQLAYCLSVHKSQGSQYECAIVVLMPESGRLLHRKVLYTAMTRAAKKCFFYGKNAALDTCIQNERDDVRHTLLAPRLEAL